MDSSEKLLWSVQVDHQLFALQKLDVTVSLDVQWPQKLKKCIYLYTVYIIESHIKYQTICKEIMLEFFYVHVS